MLKGILLQLQSQCGRKFVPTMKTDREEVSGHISFCVLSVTLNDRTESTVVGELRVKISSSMAVFSYTQFADTRYAYIYQSKLTLYDTVNGLAQECFPGEIGRRYQ